MGPTRNDRPPDEVIVRIIAAHGMWKYRLHEAIESGSSAFQVDVVAADDRCPLGQWLYGDGRRLAGQPAYEQIRTLHARFHRLTAEILALALGGQAAEARSALSSGTEFLAISAGLVAQLDAWRHPESAGLDSDPSTSEVDPVVAEMLGTSLETAAQAEVARIGGNTVGANMEVLASAVEEMNATIHQIAADSAAAADKASSARTEAETFQEGVTSLTDDIGRIGEVLSFITEVARQTKLLALNATIEAARAGHAGKGFTVVAGEVKELAQKTAAAAEDVTHRIERIQAQATATAAGMSRVAEGISTAQDAQTAIAAAVEEQSATSNEISRNVTEAAAASREIAENVAAVALAARTMTGSVRNLGAA